jgi:hypothetical protein
VVGWNPQLIFMRVCECNTCGFHQLFYIFNAYQNIFALCLIYSFVRYKMNENPCSIRDFCQFFFIIQGLKNPNFLLLDFRYCNNHPSVTRKPGTTMVGYFKYNMDILTRNIRCDEMCILTCCILNVNVPVITVSLSISPPLKEEAVTVRIS